MTDTFEGIDHCVIIVRDLDIARDRMARLGFTVTPRGYHSDHVGTANHCIMLRDGYFEVLGIRKPTEFNADWQSKLEQREGLEAVPLASNDLDFAREKLAERGISLPDAIDFSRPVDLPGEASEAVFRIIMIPNEFSPHISMFAIQHFTRDVVWYPDFLDHANGAIGVSGVIAIHEQPEKVVPAYEKLFGKEAISRSDNGVEIDTGGKGDIQFLKPDAYSDLYPNVEPDPAANSPYLAALKIEVADRDSTANYLNNHNVPHIVESRGTLCIPPLEACGTLIEFV